MGVGDGGDDLGPDLVLELEHLIGAERAIVGLRPEVSSRAGVGELSRDAQSRSRPPEASLEHEARTQIPAHGAHVEGLALVLEGGAPGYHTQVGKAGHPGDDLLGKTLGESLQVGIGPAVVEGKNGDPESLVGPRLRRARRGRRTRVPHPAQGRMNLACLLEPVLDVLFQAALEEPLQSLGKTFPDLRDGRRGIAQNRRGELGCRASLKRPSPRGDLVQNDAEREARETCKGAFPSPRLLASAGRWEAPSPPPAPSGRTWPVRSRGSSAVHPRRSSRSKA